MLPVLTSHTTHPVVPKRYTKKKIVDMCVCVCIYIYIFFFFLNAFFTIRHNSLSLTFINPLKAELNPICYLLALLGDRHFLHVSRIRVKSLIFRLLMSYIYIYIYIWSTHS